MDSERLRQLPSIDEIVSSPEMLALPDVVRVKAARSVVDRYRAAILSGEQLSLANIGQEALGLAQELAWPSLRPMVNMSGVILHTGLGRARLAEFATSGSYSNLEIDMETGARGDRQSHVRTLLQDLTGAEDALVVNNCAGAVFLALRALCADGDVLLSRGQMVEIGGSFRMPDVVREAGCRLVEVGCTNKTRLGDYESVIGDSAKAILRCHPSNFKLIGFTDEPTPSELAALAHEHGLMMIDDVGSGCLVDTTAYGLPRERTLRDAVRDGADIVTASGDKLLGGPQSGLILGESKLIAQIARHPLARAMRVDKTAIDGLEHVLRLHQFGQVEKIPTWRYAGRILKQVDAMARQLSKAWGTGATVADGLTEMGSGSLPGTGIPTRRVGIQSESATELLSRLRNLDGQGIIGRIEDGLVWLDPRTCEPDELKYAERILRDQRKQ